MSRRSSVQSLGALRNAITAQTQQPGGYRQRDHVTRLSADAVQLADVLAASVYCLIRSFLLRLAFPLRSTFPLRLALRPVLHGTSAVEATGDKS